MSGATFAAGTGLNTYPWDVVAVDDLNGDGKSDILWHNSVTGETAAWLMDGTTLIAGGALLPAHWQITRTGDFNGDGKADIFHQRGNAREDDVADEWLVADDRLFAFERSELVDTAVIPRRFFRELLGRRRD